MSGEEVSGVDLLGEVLDWFDESSALLERVVAAFKAGELPVSARTESQLFQLANVFEHSVASLVEVADRRDARRRLAEAVA